jgi:hypothetical protein
MPYVSACTVHITHTIYRVENTSDGNAISLTGGKPPRGPARELGVARCEVFGAA